MVSTGVLAGLAIVAIAAGAGCGSDDAGPDAAAQAAPDTTGTTPDRTPRPAAAAPDLPGIPAADRALVAASRGWQRLARPPVASLAGLGGAHPGEKVIRVSRRRAALVDRSGRQRFPYPRRTAVVKTGRNGGAVTLVAIMRKVAAGDGVATWRFVEYTRGGAGQPFSRVGGGQSLCAGCHVRATDEQGSDAVFFRLR
jgi:hypothetical protein